MCAGGWAWEGGSARHTHTCIYINMRVCVCARPRVRACVRACEFACMRACVYYLGAIIMGLSPAPIGKLYYAPGEMKKKYCNISLLVLECYTGNALLYSASSVPLYIYHKRSPKVGLFRMFAGGGWERTLALSRQYLAPSPPPSPRPRRRRRQAEIFACRV